MKAKGRRRAVAKKKKATSKAMKPSRHVGRRIINRTVNAPSARW